MPDGDYETDVGWLDDDGVHRGVQLPVKVKVDDRRRRDHDRPHGLERRGADGLQLPVRGHDALGDELHRAHDLPRRGRLPGLRAAERGHARAGQGHRARRARSSTRTTRAPASPASARCSAPSTSSCGRSRRWCPRRSPPGNSAHLHFISYSGFNAEEGEYWVYLEVDEGSYGGRPRQGRHGLRRLPDRQHAQQPDRGARVALPDADGALRAARRAVRGRRVPRRHRHGARQPLPRGHDRDLRGRAPRDRPAVGHLRRARGASTPR